MTTSHAAKHSIPRMPPLYLLASHSFRQDGYSGYDDSGLIVHLPSLKLCFGDPVALCKGNMGLARSNAGCVIWLGGGRPWMSFSESKSSVVGRFPKLAIRHGE